MTANPQCPGASLDELLKKLQDVELAVHALNTDLKGSAHFLAALATLQAHARGKPGLAMANSDEVKCLELIEKYFAVYRRYLNSPLGDEFAGTTAVGKGPKNARFWRPGFNRLN